ncbi:MAG: hypothetical protein HY074_20570 [Deltaproteobacteria bacterium]|nr:hypothetical protein [Deltaproteobacteria bacterium]
MPKKHLTLLATLSILANCAPPPKGQPLDLKFVSQNYATTAESITSIIATELGNISGPPTPGALLFKNCIQASCAPTSDGTGLHAIYFKKAQTCATEYGLLDGAIYMRIDSAPEFEGCATRAGPLSFKQWPPTSGKITFAIGHEAILSNGASDSEPPRTLNRNETERGLGRYWGTAALAFNGTSDVDVVLDQWLRFSSSGQNTRFHFQTSEAQLKLHLESLWDSAERVFTGSFNMNDLTHGTLNRVQLHNVSYRKKHCCHPVSGTLALSCQATTDPRDGTSTFVLDFTEVCGQAVLRDGFGGSSSIKLPECG